MLGRVFKDKGSVGEGEKRTFPLRQGERLLRLDGVKPLPGIPPPSSTPQNVPSSLTQAGGATCEEGMSGQVHSDEV